MELKLTSTDFTAQSTEGELDIDGTNQCYTLELPFTDGLPGSAIPAGRYPVVLEPSPKFLAVAERDAWVAQYASLMPHIIEIPGRSLIMFHWGNTARDTDGCVILGSVKGINFVGSSREAFARFYAKIRVEAAARNCFVTVVRHSLGDTSAGSLDSET